MDIKIENGHLIIKCPIATEPAPSKSGKSLVLASTNGNLKTSVMVQGKPVTVGFNAYISSR